jgi:hypothetical protein
VAGLRLEQRYGDLEAGEIAGDLEVDGHHAGVRARAVSGSVRIETSYADVSLEEIAGDARAVFRHGGLRVKTAGGRLQAELNDGSAHLDAVTGPLALKTRRSDVRISGLREGGRVESDGNDVELRDFSGPLEVEVRLGDVRLFPAAPLEHPLSAAIRDGGALVLVVDPGDGFRLESESRTGEVHVSLPGFEATTRERGRLVGRLGTATTPVVLRAERGDVEVRASGSR